MCRKSKALSKSVNVKLYLSTKQNYLLNSSPIRRRRDPNFVPDKIMCINIVSRHSPTFVFISREFWRAARTLKNSITNGSFEVSRDLCCSFYCDSCCPCIVVDDSMVSRSSLSSSAMAESRIIRNLLRL
jgi:hypothetical protein